MYIDSRVHKLKKTNPSSWRSEVKRISRMKLSSFNLINQIHVENTKHLTYKGSKVFINNSLVELMDTYNPLNIMDLHGYFV